MHRLTADRRTMISVLTVLCLLSSVLCSHARSIRSSGWEICPVLRFEYGGASFDFNPLLAGQPCNDWVRGTGAAYPLAALADYTGRMITQRPVTSALVVAGIGEAMGWWSLREDISNWFDGGSNDNSRGDTATTTTTTTTYTAGGNIIIANGGSPPTSGSGAATDNRK